MKKIYIKTAFTGLCLFMGFILAPSTASAGDYSKLKEIGQEHIMQCWDNLSDQEKEELTLQIEQLDIETFHVQRQNVLDPVPFTEQEISSFKDYHVAGSKEDAELGRQLIAEGRVGCLIVAGGQGSRLGFEGPKGMFPVTVVKDKSLFQVFAEKVQAAGLQVNRKLLLAIMTSSLNHAETVSYFEQNNYFGLDQSQLFFFSQTDLPFLDEKGNLFLESPSRIAAGPDGNAPSLKHFVGQGIWSDWYEKGIRYLNYVQIDNSLADPFDAELIGFHHRQQADLVIKCVTRDNPLEKVGVIVRNKGQVNVIEYSEITPEERDAREDNGTLTHICSNISLFSFKMDFVREVAEKYYTTFPFHKAWKAVKYLDEQGESRMSDQPRAWKFEKFIFDLLPYAQDVKALLYPRELCFAPLKNASGPDSIGDVKKALQRFDRKIITEISGIVPSENQVFELDFQFYYPTPELLNKWKGKALPNNSYIEP